MACVAPCAREPTSIREEKEKSWTFEALFLR